MSSTVGSHTSGPPAILIALLYQETRFIIIAKATEFAYYELENAQKNQV